MKVIIGGASNTNGPWPTWSDIVKQRYHADWVDVSRKGLGNEAIMMKALHAASTQSATDDIMIVVMLTSIDKWDWYVDRADLVARFRQEKHTVTQLSPDSPGGFWGTGSWFPLDKAYFKEHYYSQDYFTLRSLQLLFMFKQICEQKGWHYHIVYDGPIWSMTEQELNQGTPIDLSNKLVGTELCKWMYDALDIESLTYTPGMIGFLDQNNLPWFSQTYGPHPGPLAHLAFAGSQLFPILDNRLPRNKDDEWIKQEICKMDALWMA